MTTKNCPSCGQKIQKTIAEKTTEKIKKWFESYGIQNKAEKQVIYIEINKTLYNKLRKQNQKPENILPNQKIHVTRPAHTNSEYAKIHLEKNEVLVAIRKNDYVRRKIINLEKDMSKPKKPHNPF